MKSIIQSDKKCYITGSTYDLHEHHCIYGRGLRQLSEKYGLKIWLRADWHNMADYGVHFDKALDLQIKQMAQRKAMEHYGWTVEEFIKIIGRSYIC
jgi:hypothetical protein